MAYKRPTHELQDITNVMELSADLSHQSNVFKRLSTSPTKAYPDDISKPAMRLSPVKRSPNKLRTQLTPKRLASPECLKNYIPRITQSMDRPHFNRQEKVEKYEDEGSVTNLVFPSSPTKMAFRSEKKIGGDGSLSKLRSRFSNGLLSPQRFASGASSRLQGTNLFSKLEEEAEEAEKDGERTLNFKRAPERQKSTNPQEHSKIGKKRQQKTVKFQIPATGGENDMSERMNYLELTLSQVLKRQKELEDRLMMMEQRTHQDEET
ncbi:hypothetical protein HG536_0C01570 [Torulaspora globosa]|uniref:Uncharacterized protein n=1 Tax=Torulaspora globosa TaxID=48254 RepID=A0A7G3ZEQ3_9SACH|nr:uncharacterized protein HG536_0C01570 [Torulaspora globosa]QLL31989.1 hypothetical protein HG536_0C01570 [Torulaspora globosa]